MTEAELMQLLAAITPPDETARAAAHAHWASLAKPLGGLGALETLLEDAAALTGTAQFDFSRRAVAVLCADNGVVAQGISQTDQSVTRAVAENLAARRTSVCRMAQAAHCDVLPVDLGIAGAPVPGVRDCRIAAGTADFTKGPAMTRAEAVEAIGRGIALTRQLAAEGYRRDGHWQHHHLQRRSRRAAGTAGADHDRARCRAFRCRACPQGGHHPAGHCLQCPQPR